MPPKETDGNKSDGTGEGNTPPAATPPNDTPAATPTDAKQTPSSDDDKVVLSKQDYQNLISQRDKANNAKSENTDVVNYLMQKDAVNDAVSDPSFKDKYPDVTAADLLEANPTSEEEIAEIAKAKQARYSQIKQAAIADTQVATEPEMSPEDVNKKLDELRANPSRRSFGEALRLRAKLK